MYLKDINHFDRMNEVYRRYFPEGPPARATIGGIALADPAFFIEIDMVALQGEQAAS